MVKMTRASRDILFKQAGKKTPEVNPKKKGGAQPTRYKKQNKLKK